MNELVSVVIPTYNRKHTLKRAMDSVLNQTYKNIEIIIVDDGSNDGTLDFVQECYGDLENLVYVINETNLGPAGSRNAGVNYAKGEYIAFQDSDDEWEYNKLEKQMELFEKHPEVGMVYCGQKWQEPNGEWSMYPGEIEERFSKTGDVFSTLLVHALIGTPTMLIRKDCFFEVGGFQTELKALEDYEFSIRFAKNYRIEMVEEPLLTVHKSSNSVNQQEEETLLTQCYILQTYYEDLKKYGLLEYKLQQVFFEACEEQLLVLFLHQLLDSERPEYIEFVKSVVNSCN